MTTGMRDSLLSAGNADDKQSREPASARIAVACESTACLPPSLVERYAIDVVPIPFVFGEETFLDGVTITPREFYAKLEAAPAFPQTSPPSPGEYLRAWRSIAQRADALVLVTASGKITSFSRSTRLAQQMAAEALPNLRVEVVDSGSAAMGQGFVTLAAARAAAAGEPLEQVVAAANDVRQRVQMIVTLDTLEYLARASRIPQVAAFVGSVLAIKPILLFDQGDVIQLGRVRTRQRSIEQLLAQVHQRVPQGARLHATVHHTQAEPEARQLERSIAANFDCAELFVTEFSPVMGAYCGPGLLGVAFFTEATEAQAHEGAG
jgi:DegV family protein with EDD domain